MAMKDSKKNTQRVFLVIAVIGFLFMASGLGFTGWFLLNPPGSGDSGGENLVPVDGDGTGEDNNDKPVCNGLNISLPVVSDTSGEISLSASGSDADMDQLSEISIMVAAGGQINEGAQDLLCTDSESYYCNPNAWSYVARQQQSNSISATTTFETLKQLVDEQVSATGYAYQGDIEDLGFVLKADVMGQFSTDLCSSNIARVEGNGAYYGQSATAWDSTCEGGCFGTIIYEKIDPPSDLACNVECGGDKGTCGGGLQCIGGRCRQPQCENEVACICPTEPEEGLLWGVSKSGKPVCEADEEGMNFAVMTYSIIIRNSSDESGRIVKVEDIMDQRVERDWIDPNFLPEYAVVSGASNGAAKIVWTLPQDMQIVEPGQTKTIDFVLNVPEENFGTYGNNVYVTPGSGDGDVFHTKVENDISCNIPATGLFDTTESRILGAAALVIISSLMIGLESTDKGVLKFIKGTEKVKENTVQGVKGRYGKEARVEKSRDEFERKV